MAKRYSYTVWIGSLQFSVKAKDAIDAKKQAARQYRERRKLWHMPLSDIVKRATARRD